jgi:dihydrofolate reductase
MNNGIGDKDGNLLFNIEQDMKRFVSATSGKHVVMGRKTWDSLPNKPLKNRKNYVLTMDEEFEAEGATVLKSIDEVVELAKGRDVFIIGGGEIYYQTIDIADKLLITHVHVINENARVFFPDFGSKDWKIKNHEQHKVDDFTFAFANYERKQV